MMLLGLGKESSRVQFWNGKMDIGLLNYLHRLLSPNFRQTVGRE